MSTFAEKIKIGLAVSGLVWLGLYLLSSDAQSKTIINYHGGGVVSEVIEEINSYSEPIEIHGLCGSSCTFALTKNTCVKKDATIIIHSAQSPKITVRNAWNAAFAVKFADKGYLDLADFFLRLDTPEDHVYSGEEMNNFFKIPLCT